MNSNHLSISTLRNTQKIILMGLLLVATSFLFAQTKPGGVINAKEVARIENILSSDELKGRKVLTPEIDKAADFIANEFRKAGLQVWNDGKSYRQEFSIIRPKIVSISASFDGNPLDDKKVIVVTCQQQLRIDEHSGYETVYIKEGSQLLSEARKLIHGNKNYLVLVNSAFASNFERLSNLKRSLFKTDKTVVFVLADSAPLTYKIEANHEITESKMANVVGILPGKSKKNEYVIFSAHYDHLGIGEPVNGDSIYNGANDDAAGTTAVIMLAKYFKSLGNNERTIIFAAFTAEELGGIGSQYFSQQFDPFKVAAMINIEMIGTESKWGKNAAYITGFDKSDLGSILQKNLEGSNFKFYPDPYPNYQLFYRSDNATLARQGVPAHTISTSQMDKEPHYHKVSDQVETLDLENMAMIINSIALCAKTVVDGTDTPTRVKVEELR